jgi:hypothetical protein
MERDASGSRGGFAKLPEALSEVHEDSTKRISAGVIHHCNRNRLPPDLKTGNGGEFRVRLTRTDSPNPSTSPDLRSQPSNLLSSREGVFVPAALIAQAPSYKLKAGDDLRRKPHL